MKQIFTTLALIAVITMTSTLTFASETSKPATLVYTCSVGDVYLESSESGALTIYREVLRNNGCKIKFTLPNHEETNLKSEMRAALITLSTQDQFENSETLLFGEKWVKTGCTSIFKKSASHPTGACFLDYEEAKAYLAKMLK